MMRLTLLSAAAISAVHASVSTSVFPNSLCQGASDSLGGLVGVGKVTLANGDVEVHCGCPSDNLADFEACPSSATGESVCNSVYDMSTGEFSASCGVIACSGADCLNTIVNEVVTHEDECFNSDRGSIGIATVNGEASCGCSSEVDAADFTACAAPAHGKATCTTTDPDFLGAAYDHAVQVECGVVCNEGFVLAPGGACTKVVKRDMMPIGAPAPIIYASTSANGGSWNYGSSTPATAMPTTTSYHPHQAHTTSGAASSTTTSYSYKYHHGHSSSTGHGNGGSASSSWVAPSSTNVPWVSRTSTDGMNNGGHASSSASWMSYSTMPAPPTSSGVNHNAHPTTTGGPASSSSSMMMPTTTSYSYNQWNGHSSNDHSASASASASMMHWAHKRDAVPTAAPAYVYKQHNARAPANHHRRSSSASGMYPSSSSASIPWGHRESPSGSASGSSWMPSSSGGYGGSSSMMMPTTTPSGSNHYAHTTTTAAEETTTSYSYKYHHHQSSSGANGGSSSSSGMASSSSMMNWMPAPSMGPSGSNHNAHNPSDSPSSSSSMMMGSTTTTTGAVVPTTTMMYGSTTSTPGPSQRAARRAAAEFVFSDVCAQDERTCPGDDILCVRLDDVTQCGGCHATGDAVNCLEIEGASSVSCLRGGCVVRSCQTGYFQTAEGRCERL